MDYYQQSLEQYGINGTIGMIEAISQEQLRRLKDDTIKIAGILPNQVRQDSCSYQIS